MSKSAQQQALKFPSSRAKVTGVLKSEGISSELKVGSGDIFGEEGIGGAYKVVFFAREAGRGFTYSYVKIFQ